MKQKFTYLALLVATLFITQGTWAQAVGDYQTHTGGPGNWNNTASWEQWNGASWVTPAPAIPNANTGLLTIKDNITLDVSVTISHAIVNNNATFSVNQTGGITLTIAKSAAANDLEITSGSTLVLGDLVPTGDETIAGSGASPSIVIDNGGSFTFNSGTLNVITTVNGGGTTTLANTNIAKSVMANFTNNGTMTWNSGPSAGGLSLTGATFTNGGTFIESLSSDRGFINGGSSSIINAGIFTKSTTHQVLTNSIPVTNSGTIQGMGTVDFGGSTFTNAGSGILAPGAANGSSVAVLNVTPNAITSNATTLKINITGASNTPGTDYSQMVSVAAFSGAPTTPDIDLSNATLTLVDAGTGPATTVYTILDAGTGNITGNFATTNVTSNYTIAVNPHTVTATKNTVLPITWGPFDALVQSNNTVLLDWTTYLESNTSHFVVDYSTDGKVFNSIGTVTAAGNSSTTLQYSFKHNSPNLNGTNFYRLQEVDRDGKSNYSPVRVVRFANAQALKVLVLPNPVHDQLQMTVQEQNITASLYSGDGRLLRTWRLQPGTQQVNIGDLPAGNYQLMVSQKDQQIETQHLIKL